MPPGAGAIEHENYSPPLEGRCEKIGRASLLASRHPSKSLPHEARREPRPPGPMSVALRLSDGSV